ncbi:hypothetical protein B0J11DRAFT_266921 [Dendryphion nanum]|uniref:Uncharacterized protein n=1 Tax=Dendryphion nanum TaxID=256645 RepID=A0A9P9E091_9PLEO|nr:hypothetical protein B0J11DRAFT_266921 [Dendryphion nanum]
MGKYPGLGYPLRYNYKSETGLRQESCEYPIGAHPNCPGARTKLLFVRELAMMDIMEKLTDKEDWYKKVFNDEIVTKWREEAFAIPDEDFRKLAKIEFRNWNWVILVTFINAILKADTLEDKTSIQKLSGIMSENSFDYCIKELQDKAKYFEASGIVPTLDADASVAKSDILVTPELHKSLRDAFEKLHADQTLSPDWHPNSNNMVQDLVHPSMYPLVYGRSRVYQDEVVGVTDAVDKWAGKGTIIEPFPSTRNENASSHMNYGIDEKYWSEKYQWLPANLSFNEDGTVKFTSYINNLHPIKYSGIYQALEKLVETSLPLWDQCLTIMTSSDSKEYAGRQSHRIFEPEIPCDSNDDNWTPSYAECAKSDNIDMEEFRDEYGYETDEEKENEDAVTDLESFKWQKLRKPVIPEPEPYDLEEYAPQEGKCLIDRFKESGLQIIVKIASIELTPEKPEFAAGGWHVEGMMNEHICATSLYYLDCENVTSSRLSFRMQTSADLSQDYIYKIGQDSYYWMESVYGTNLGSGNGGSCLQNYGNVETKQGRLLAFPNLFHHRVSGFRLADPSKPGHRRFIALWLVDPTKRIISTANVPPQQMDWWKASAFGATPEAQQAISFKHGSIGIERNLPQELADMVREEFSIEGGQLPMSVEEANEHRLTLMEERSNFKETAENEWNMNSYSFCEH